jgi:hypothetical protein
LLLSRTGLMPDRVWFGDRPLYSAFRPRYFGYGRAVVSGYDTLFRLDGSADLFRRHLREDYYTPSQR